MAKNRSRTENDAAQVIRMYASLKKGNAGRHVPPAEESVATTVTLFELWHSSLDSPHCSVALTTPLSWKHVARSKSPSKPLFPVAYSGDEQTLGSDTVIDVERIAAPQQKRKRLPSLQGW